MQRLRGCGQSARLPASATHPRRRAHVAFAEGGFGGGVDSPEPAEIGARDPYESELQSNFTEKQLHFADTEHAIKIPERAKQFFGLARQPIDPSHGQLEEKEARLLAKRVLSWTMEQPPGLSNDCANNFRLSREWECNDINSAQCLRERLMTAVTDAEYTPCAELMVVDGNRVRGEIGNAKERTVTKNDFILAARLDSVQKDDLVPQSTGHRKLPFL